MYDYVKIGNQVKWRDPALSSDHDEDEFYEVLNTVYTIDEIRDEIVTDDTVVLISNEYSEAEVYACELYNHKTIFFS